MKACHLQTERAVQAIDVSDLVKDFVRAPGLYLVSCPHTTAAMILSESDEDLLWDYETAVQKIISGLGPLRHRKNNNPNGAAHIMSGVFGTQVLVPSGQEGTELGTYQRLVFLELDGPRQRSIEVRRISGGGGGAD